MKNFIMVLALVSATTAAFADGERDLSSKAPKKSVSQRIREHAQSCFDSEMALFERSKGRLPTDDEADFIIDACVNAKLR